MQPNHFSRVERAPHVESIEPEGVAEWSEELGQQLKLAFEKVLPQLLDRFPSTRSLFTQDAANRELSVVTYVDSSHIRERLDGLDLADTAAANAIPYVDAALIEIRLPHLLRMDAVNSQGLINLKGFLKNTLWSVHTHFLQTHPVDIERVNYIGEHDDTPLSGYQYLWLMTPRGKMPTHFIPQDSAFDL